MSEILFMAVHASEQLTLAESVAYNQLIIHLGTPTTRIDLAGHGLTWRHLEVLGRGAAELVDGNRLLCRWTHPVVLGAR